MAQAVWNATRQAAGVSALRSSSLQLLESLESLEAKVDTAVPGVQREISRLEFNLAETRALAKENNEDIAKLRIQLKKHDDDQQIIEDRTATTAALAAALEAQIYNVTERITLLEHSKLHRGRQDDSLAEATQLGDLFLNIPTGELVRLSPSIKLKHLQTESSNRNLA